MEQSAAAWGLPLDAHQANAGTVWLWPEHAEALEVFADCATQWRILVAASGACYQGLDYSAVEAVLRMRATEKQSEIFQQVRTLEAGALPVLNS